jgi:predicted permease
MFCQEGNYPLEFIKTFAPFIYDIVFPFLLAFLLVKYTKLHSKSFDILILFQMRLFFPIGALLSIWGLNLNVEMIWLPIAGLLMHLLPLFLAYIRIKKYDFNYREKASYLLVMLISNAAMLGAMTSFFVLGETSYAYTNLILSLGPFAVSGIGFTLAAKYQSLAEGTQTAGMKGVLKNLLSLNQMALYASIAGLILSLSGIPRPAFSSQVLSINIHFSMWTAVMPIGAALSFAGIKKYKFVTMDYTVIKFLIVPIILFLLSLLFVKDDPLALKTILIVSASPAPMVAVMLSKLYHLDVDLALSPFVYTTVIYLIVLVPLFIVLMNYVWI